MGFVCFVLFICGRCIVFCFVLFMMLFFWMWVYGFGFFPRVSVIWLKKEKGSFSSQPTI